MADDEPKKPEQSFSNLMANMREAADTKPDASKIRRKAIAQLKAAVAAAEKARNAEAPSEEEQESLLVLENPTNQAELDGQAAVDALVDGSEDEYSSTLLKQIQIVATTIAVFHATGDDQDRTALETANLIIQDAEGNKEFNKSVLSNVVASLNTNTYESEFDKLEDILIEFKRRISNQISSSPELDKADEHAMAIVYDGNAIDTVRKIPYVFDDDELQNIVFGKDGSKFDLSPVKKAAVETPIITIGAGDAAAGTEKQVENPEGRKQKLADLGSKTRSKKPDIAEGNTGDETEVSTSPGLSLTAAGGDEDEAEAEGGDSNSSDLAKALSAEDVSGLTKLLESLVKAQTPRFSPLKSKIDNGFKSAIKNKNASWLAKTLEIESSKRGSAVFKDNVMGHHIKVTPNEISHVDNDGKFSMQEAIQFITLASANPKMMNEGITINGGTPGQQAMLVVAAKLLEASGQTVPKINNENSVKPEIIAQVAQVEQKKLAASGQLTQDGIQFDKFRRKTNPDVGPTEEDTADSDNIALVENSDQDVEKSVATEDTDEVTTSDAPEIDDVTSEDTAEVKPKDVLLDARFMDLPISGYGPQTISYGGSQDFGRASEKTAGNSPTAAEVKGEFAAKSNLTEKIYNQVVEHVREVGKPTQAEIKKALGNAGLEHGIHDAYKDAVDNMIAQSVIIEHTVGDSPVPQRRLVEPS